MSRRSQNGRQARDLFGEILVTWPEIWDWLEAIPKIPRNSWRASYYIKYWNVPDKIRAAKLNGSYDKIIHQPG